MVNRVLAVGMAAILGLAILPIDVSAKGFGGHGFHGARHFSPAFVFGPFGGFVATDQIMSGAPVVNVSAPQPVGPLVSPTFVLQCHHTEEIKMVPSEEGGTREIKISRC
jgi:hypothetical protein